MAELKYLDEAGLARLAGKVVERTSVATVERAGVVRPDGTSVRVAEDGTISAVGGGGGASAAPFALEVGSDGHLYVYYDDGTAPPALSIEGGHLYWTYETAD